ncbi:MAG: hypothetical protein ACK58T_35495, partial [Phycisphaerae bacterium]
MDLDVCPKCNSTHIYQDGYLWVCPECGHEWSARPAASAAAPSVDEAVEDQTVKDANGNVLQ